MKTNNTNTPVNVSDKIFTPENYDKLPDFLKPNVSERTKGEWKVDDYTNYLITDSEGENVAMCSDTTFGKSSANAEYIVRACNNHESLLSALNKYKNILASFNCEGLGTEEMSLLVALEAIFDQTTKEAINKATSL
jgi:predicted fused transcriptional regulator/phosphomethylpyrimidine kinase